MSLSSPVSRFLHVANGTATTRLIQAAAIEGAASLWADPLSEGPVPGDLTDEELADVRMRYLAGVAGEAAFDEVNDLRAWRAAIARRESYDELVLWFEHDLFDQLNLVQLLAWVREQMPAGTPASLVCIGSFPGHPRFKGLGELSAAELGSLLGARERVSDRQYAMAARAWQAFREPTPEGLDALRRAGTGGLPYLAPAIARFLQEYPWVRDGLSRTERRLLELADGRRPLAALLALMHEGEDAYYVTDLSLALIVESLAHTSPPLLDRSAGLARAGALSGHVAVTEFGRDVLARRVDRVAACGFDRWLGGVHWQRGVNEWRWDDRRQQVTKG